MSQKFPRCPIPVEPGSCMGPGAVAEACTTERLPTKQKEPLNQRQTVDGTLASPPKRKAQSGAEPLPCCKRQAIEGTALLARTDVQDGSLQHASCKQPEHQQDAHAAQLPAMGSAGQAPQLDPAAPPADCPGATPAFEGHLR